MIYNRYNQKHLLPGSRLLSCPAPFNGDHVGPRPLRPRPSHVNSLSARRATEGADTQPKRGKDHYTCY